jgi:hypothetical protein
MAKAKVSDLKVFRKKTKVSRPGRHRKSDSQIKGAKTYKKKYRGQGK